MTYWATLTFPSLAPSDSSSRVWFQSPPLPTPERFCIDHCHRHDCLTERATRWTACVATAWWCRPRWKMSKARPAASAVGNASYAARSRMRSLPPIEKITTNRGAMSRDCQVISIAPHSSKRKEQRHENQVVGALHHCDLPGGDGHCAELKVVEIPTEVESKIEKHSGGAECVSETHRTWNWRGQRCGCSQGLTSTCLRAATRGRWQVESMLWIVGGIIAVSVAILLVPVLVVGTWFVVMTVIMGIADGGLWVLDRGWKRPARMSRSEATRVRPVKVSGTNGDTPSVLLGRLVREV